MVNYAGAPLQPIKPVSSSPGDAPLSKGELTRKKNKREKNKEPIAPEDEPRYVAKVQKQREALLKKESEKKQPSQEDKTSSE